MVQPTATYQEPLWRPRHHAHHHHHHKHHAQTPTVVTEQLADVAAAAATAAPPARPTQMEAFTAAVAAKRGLTFDSYESLRKWSVDKYDEFWGDLWQFVGIKHSKPYEQVVDMTKQPVDVPEWFRGSRLNYAEHLLEHPSDKVALIGTGENTPPTRYTFGQLKALVSRIAAALKKQGVKSGDRVVGYVPNCIEAVAAMLATASLGAAWSSTSPDFGVKGVVERISQISPRVVFSVNAVHYNGRVHDHTEKLDAVVRDLSTVQRVVVFPFVQEHPSPMLHANWVSFDAFLNEASSPTEPAPALVYEQVPFNHPLFIMFSSGTTGIPKCMVHSVGGTLLQHLKEHRLHGDLTSDDVILYYTTAGWMMWNWLMTALAVGATVVLYDGSPFIPSPNVLWDLVDELSITVLGTGAKWLAALEEKKLVPKEAHHFNSLRCVLSTGSPLKPESYDYVYNSIKQDIVLGSITGGTDIISLFAGHHVSLPVYRGEIQCRCLGMDVQAWDDDGKEVFDVAGELVCVKPFPCQPVFFINDDDGKKYKKAYFSKYPGVWSHGDYMMVSSQTGGVVMLGRSDGTLNPAGVRFGSAEIYNIVEQPELFPEILDALCVGQKMGADERVVLFLMLRNGESTLDKALLTRIQSTIRAQLSARHVPAIILPIADIPYTINNKKVEVAVKKIISGEPVTERGALRNPDSLDLYANLAALAL
ncbi:acetoacetyl-CoA synthetase [Capsaspora owczarzaki ATCC 30864]|nr:acetoacetyl-CoA synthetase [Capsaspora owczarzaki ATCC 30864]|eukprot:XP_004364994.2 acetoacetyl-CoA synthetase [Capsaspora owczarzaki ATCC 30864]